MPRPRHPSFPIVGVGASAGGLEAFTQLLKHLPLDTGMGFVLVQHLDPEHESALAQILSRETSLQVHEISNNERVEPNQVYVIPRDTNLTIADGVLQLNPRERSRTPHRPIDSFFESLAHDQHERAIGVVLSGTASDGTLGLRAIKAEGGITFAQDDSAKHYSMPRSAVAAGCVDLILSPADIARELGRISKHPYATSPSHPLPASIDDDRGEADRGEATAHQDDDSPLPSGGKASRPEADDSTNNTGAAIAEAGPDSEGYKNIMLFLRNHSGVDFSLYRSTTIQRRINRRVVLSRHDSVTDYVAFLRGNARELDTLYSDVLISVTSFFRNPEMFDALKRTVLPELLEQPGDRPLRCWVLGCSTGQEAYSIGISFLEAADEGSGQRGLQIFATDVNEALLDKARRGLYANSLADDIAPERLRRFFIEEDGGYRVTKQLREMVVFARHNIISDPPFSRMDLISCRNVLIYLEPTLQKKALPTFHYALKPGGFLLLGASESVGTFTDLFEPVDKRLKIYSRQSTATPPFHLSMSQAHGERRASAHPPSMPRIEEARGGLYAQREADRVSLSQFAPPGVLINDARQVLQFRGSTGAYLEPPAGKASFDVLKMAREGLMLPLRAAINEARKSDRTARKDGIHIQRDGRSHTVRLEVIPLKNLPERCFLILFEEADKAPARTRRPEPKTKRIAPSEEPSRIAALETTLAETREYMQSMLEQHEAAAEELQAAHEEVQSSNEELQSVNEELETSKEELESANEELVTVNEEMAHRNAELNRLNNDLVNLQVATKLAVVLLGRDLTIRRFSPAAEKQFDLLATDVGRPIGHIVHRLVGVPPGANLEALQGATPFSTDAGPADLEAIAAETIKDMREQQRLVRDHAGHWYSLRVRPYVTPENKVDGAVLVLMDVDAIKASEQAMAAARDYAENTIATVREPLIVVDADLRIESANRSFYRTFHLTPEETIGKSIHALGSGQWAIPQLRKLLEGIIRDGTTIEDFVVEYESDSQASRVMLLNARRIVDPQYKSTRILLAIEEITERTRAQTALRESEEGFRMLADNMTQFAWTADPRGWIYWYNKRWYAYTGTTLGEMQGSGWKKVVHPEHVARVSERIQHSFDSGEPWEDIFPIRNMAGEYRWFLSRAQPLRDEYEGVLRWFGTHTDVTEQREMENQIKIQARQLADESRRKDEFLAMLSHELRNPLAPIQSAIHMLRSQDPGDTSIQEEAYAIIDRQVANLTKLINDLLEVSRVVSGRIRMTFQAVDLNQIVLNAIETVRPLIEQHHHELVVNLAADPVWIDADAVRAEEVFVNLLNNAAKFTPDGGRIEVSCHAPRGDHFATVRVRDNGAGIEDQLLAGIFNLFTQAQRSLDRSAGGLGIGLSLAERLVKLHGGSIEVQSPPAGSSVGSEFLVKLPISRARPSARRAEGPTTKIAHAPSGTRILVVDDNADQVSMLSLFLRDAGYAVTSCYSGPDALRLAQECRPDIVLLDIGLPGLNGYEVARRLRSDSAFGSAGQRLRLIALTGYGQDADIATAMEAGFDAHLVKPYAFSDLEPLLVPEGTKPE